MFGFLLYEFLRRCLRQIVPLSRSLLQLARDSTRRLHLIRGSDDPFEALRSCSAQRQVNIPTSEPHLLRNTTLTLVLEASVDSLLLKAHN